MLLSDKVEEIVSFIQTAKPSMSQGRLRPGVSDPFWTSHLGLVRGPTKHEIS